MGIANPSPDYLCSGRDYQLTDVRFFGVKMMINESNDERRYDYIVVGAGAAGSVLAAELSASGAQVLIIESGGPDDAPTTPHPRVCSQTSAARSITTCPSSPRRD